MMRMMKLNLRLLLIMWIIMVMMIMMIQILVMAVGAQDLKVRLFLVLVLKLKNLQIRLETTQGELKMDLLVRINKNVEHAESSRSYLPRQGYGVEIIPLNKFLVIQMQGFRLEELHRMNVTFLVFYQKWNLRRLKKL